MANIRVKDLDTKASFASDDEILMDSPSGTGTMLRDAFISAVAAQIVAAPSTYKIATLDGADKLTSSQDPSQSVSYLGGHDMVANSPALADGSGTAGDTYYVTNPGTRDYGSGNITAQEGDALVYSGSVWQLVEGIANILDGISTAATARTTLEVNSVDEDAEATGTKLVGPALYFDGSNDYVEVAADSKLSFTDGTDDLPFSVSAFIKADDLTTCPVVGKYGTSAPAREWRFAFDGSDKLELALFDTGGHVALALSTTALTSYEGQWFHVCATYAGSAASAFTTAADQITMYVNGQSVSVNATNDFGGTYDGMTDGTNPLWVGRYNNSYKKSHIRNVQIYNRELTATEVAELAKGNELGFADEWGGAYGGAETSDFTAGVDGYSASNGTVDGNIDIGGQNDNLRLTVDNTTAVHRINTPTYLTAGKRYTGHLYYYIPSGQSNVDGASLRFTNGDIIESGLTTLDAWTKVDLDFIATTAGLELYATDGGATTFTDAGGDDVLYIRDVKITQLGNLADFRSERFDSSTDKWYDLSDNAFVGTNSGATLVGREVPVYETGTWTPVLTFGGGSTGITYTTQEGLYTRVGNTVWVSAYVVLSAKGSDTGTALVNGLPFTASNTAASSQSFVVGNAANAANLTSAITAYATDNGTTVNLVDWGATGSAVLDDTNFAATTSLSITGTYQIQ